MDFDKLEALIKTKTEDDEAPVNMTYWGCNNIDS